jgi:hypothetical protein
MLTETVRRNTALSRPRISRREAAYIVEVLQATQIMLQAKRERLEWLRSEVAELHKRRVYDAYGAMKEGYTAKKQELARLECEATDLSWSLNLHYRMTQKYTAIANGEPHDGRYKHLSLTKSSVMFPRCNLLIEVSA